MFENLTPRPPDAIMHLMAMAKADKNPDKIDLGAGVYKSPQGGVPIMRSVRQAEIDHLSQETSKTYVSTVGHADFRRLLLELVLGKNHKALKEKRIASAQATGGSGALRLGAEMIYQASPDATIWVSTPTWANHVPLISSAGFKMESYPYYNRETLGVDFDDMINCLKDKAKAGDVVLIHGCCHNPTGADLSPSEWDKVSALMAEMKLIPFVDLAYFGLGRGMEEDSYGLRKVIELNDEVVVAASCSKNFGLYKERVGLIAVVAANAEQASTVQTLLGATQRRIVSMPPDHGASIVATILGSAELRADWIAELTDMRERMLGLRRALSEALNVQGGEVIARAVKDQNGMFSTLPLTQSQAEKLRSEHSVYLLNSGRMNIAGASLNNIPRLAGAILDVL